MERVRAMRAMEQQISCSTAEEQVTLHTCLVLGATWVVVLETVDVRAKDSDFFCIAKCVEPIFTLISEIRRNIVGVFGNGGGWEIREITRLFALLLLELTPPSSCRVYNTSSS